MFFRFCLVIITITSVTITNATIASMTTASTVPAVSASDTAGALNTNDYRFTGRYSGDSDYSNSDSHNDSNSDSSSDSNNSSSAPQFGEARDQRQHHQRLRLASNENLTPNPPPHPNEPKAQSSRKKSHYRTDNRFGITAMLSPVSLPFPMAYGVSAYYVASPNWLLELEYLRSKFSIGIFGFEVGESVEQKLALQARYFPSDRGSFNFIMGIGKRNLDIRLARDLFDLATGDYSLAVSEFSAPLLRLGLANQWQWKEKYTITLDWIAIDIPFNAKVEQSAVQFAENEEDRKDIEDAESFLKWYPSGAIVKMNLGISF